MKTHTIPSTDLLQALKAAGAPKAPPSRSFLVWVSFQAWIDKMFWTDSWPHLDGGSDNKTATLINESEREIPAPTHDGETRCES